MIQKESKSQQRIRSPSLFLYRISFPVSVYAARASVLIALGISNAGVAAADSDYMATLFLVYAAIELSCAAMLYRARRSIGLQRVLCLSAIWAAMVAVDHLFGGDLLYPFDTKLNTVLEAAMLAAIIMEVARCWKSAPQ